MQRRSVLHHYNNNNNNNSKDHDAAAATATATTTTMKHRHPPPPSLQTTLQRKDSNSKVLPTITRRRRRRRVRKQDASSSFLQKLLLQFSSRSSSSKEEEEEDVMDDLIQSGFTLVLIVMLLALIALVVYLLSTLAVASTRSSSSSSNSRNKEGLIHELKHGDTVADMEPLPWNPIYRPVDSMDIVGDRSNHYARLRHEIDPLLTPDVIEEQFAQLVAKQQGQQGFQYYAPRSMETHHSDQVPYDIYDCPDHPPAGYPFTWKTIDILRDWPPDQTTPPIVAVDDDENGNKKGSSKNAAMIYHSLCIFDYTKDYDKAITYREAMKPFIVVNDPQVQETVARWSLPKYMDRLLGTVPHRTEHSESNHFMYYVPQPKNIRKRGRRRRNADKIPQDWTAPTKAMRMPYYEWLQHANVTDEHTTPDSEHWYFRLIGCGTTGNDGSCDNGSSEYLSDELPFFQPKPSLYVVEPDMQKGIHCRFGMKGVIAENHFDSSRNSIVLLSGSRRYILAHPDQCDNMALYEKGHPSARHSAVDWGNPDLEEFPQFANALSNEVVLQPGQVLYLPTNWFHFIVSLELNMQCNTRSGLEPELMTYVRECGF